MEGEAWEAAYATGGVKVGCSWGELLLHVLLATANPEQMPHGCVPGHKRVTSHSLRARNNQTSHGNGQSPTLSFPNDHFAIKNSKLVFMCYSCRTKILDHYFIVYQKLIYLLIQVVARHLLTNPNTKNDGKSTQPSCIKYCIESD
jgi:hypothetical protein